jgi:hypothetical protein
VGSGGAWDRQRTTPPAGGRRLVADDGKTPELVSILHLTDAANITAAL